MVRDIPSEITDEEAGTKVAEVERGEKNVVLEKQQR